jgi:hypothetical protein
MLDLNELKKIIETLKDPSLNWDRKKATDGYCDDCDDCSDNTERKVIDVPVEYDSDEQELRRKKLCKKHLTENREEIRKAYQDGLKELEPLLKEETEFHQKLDKVTRFAQIKDLVEAVRAVIQKKRRSYDEEAKFTDEDLLKGKRLLQFLKKIEPKSSQFIDRGVAINQNLFLSGTAEAQEYSSRAENEIVLTSLDKDERYRSIARVHLTLGEAERLRNLLHECIEHVRIKGMISLLEEHMEIKLEPEKDEDEEA